MKTKCSMLREFIKEEAQTSKLYKRLGFAKQGNQEKEHSMFFKKQLNKCGGKTQ